MEREGEVDSLDAVPADVWREEVASHKLVQQIKWTYSTRSPLVCTIADS